MKRIIICCDGTWSTFDAKYPTNVVRFERALKERGDDGIENSIYYDEGVGTGKTAISQGLDRIASGVFGIGVLSKVEMAYHNLVLNYNPGDQIYIIGFSRGAFTARSLAGLIRLCGIPQGSTYQIHDAIDLYRQRKANSSPDNEKAMEFRLKHSPNLYLSDDEIAWRKSRNENIGGLHKLEIDYIGVWETVGALGIPKGAFGLSKIFNANSEFHDTELSTNVKTARHAVAIDERRKAYEPTLWTNLPKRNAQKGYTGPSADAPYQQVWFPGDHSSIGGGKATVGLANRTLLWIIEGAQKAGLSFDQHAVDGIRALCDFNAPLYDPDDKGILRTVLPKEDREGPDSIEDVDITARQRWDTDPLYRPKSLDRVWEQMSLSK